MRSAFNSIVQTSPSLFDAREEQVVQVAASVLMYAAKGTKNPTMRKELRALELPKDEVLKMRDVAMGQDTIARLKYGLYDAVKAKKTTLRQINGICDDNGIDRADAEIIRVIVRDRQRAAAVRRVIGKRHIPHPDAVDTEVERLLLAPNIEQFVGRFVYAKLRAFAAAERMDRADYATDLIEAGIRTYRWYRPLYTPAHALNAAKRGLRTAGIRTISHWTASCRARLVQSSETSSGYDGTVRNMMINTEDGETVDPMVENVSSVRDYDRAELRMSLEQAERTLIGMDARAFKLLALKDDGEFCCWFIERTGQPAFSTAGVYGYCEDAEEYMDLVRRFCGFKRSAFRRLLDEFRKVAS